MALATLKRGEVYMTEEPRDDAACCVECGDDVAPAVDRVYPVFQAWVICMDCAHRRGGVYDASCDRWLREPHLDDLRDRPREPPNAGR
jgi:hypothetical protein